MAGNAGRPPIDRLGLAGLVLFAIITPFLPDNPAKVWGTIAAGACFAFASYPRRTALDWPVGVLIGVVLLATVLGAVPWLSFLPTVERGDGALVWVVYGLAALVAARLSTAHARRLFFAVLAVGALQGLLAVVETWGLLPPLSRNMIPYNGHGYGTLGNTMFLSGAEVLLLPPALVVGLVWLPLCMVAGLIAANQRIGWLGLMMVVPALIRLRPRLLIAIGAVLAFLVAFHRRVIAAGLPFDDLAPRWWMWTHTLPLIQARPWLGWGLSTLRLHGGHWFPLPGLVDNPHNEWLYLTFSFGLLGLVGYLWVLWTAGRALWYAPREAQGLLLGLVAYAVWGLANWSHLGVANLWWTLIGLSIPLGDS